MAIGAKHATICLPSCAVYYAWHRKWTRGKAANSLAWHWDLGGCDFGEIVLSALDSRDWWRWLESLHWRAMKQEWRKHPISVWDQNFHPLSCVMCDFQVGKGGSKCWFLDVIMPLVSNLPNTVQDLRMINDIMAKPDWIMFGEVEYFMTVLVRFQLIFLNNTKYPACRELSPYRPYQELISNDIFIVSWTKKRF